MVASALQGIPGLTWHAIRSASDSQIANPNNNIKAAVGKSPADSKCEAESFKLGRTAPEAVSVQRS